MLLKKWSILMEPRIKLLIADEDIKARNDIKEKLSNPKYKDDLQKSLKR